MNDHFEIESIRSKGNLLLEKYQRYGILMDIVLAGIANLILFSWLKNELPKIALGGLSEIGIYDVLVVIILELIDHLEKKIYEYGNKFSSIELWCFHLKVGSRIKLGALFKIVGGIIIAITSIRMLLETIGIYRMYGFSWILLFGISPFVDMGILGQILTELGKAVHMGISDNRKK